MSPLRRSRVGRPALPEVLRCRDEEEDDDEEAAEDVATAAAAAAAAICAAAPKSTSPCSIGTGADR